MIPFRLCTIVKYMLFLVFNTGGDEYIVRLLGYRSASYRSISTAVTCVRWMGFINPFTPAFCNGAFCVRGRIVHYGIAGVWQPALIGRCAGAPRGDPTGRSEPGDPRKPQYKSQCPLLLATCLLSTSHPPICTCFTGFACINKKNKT